MDKINLASIPTIGWVITGIIGVLMIIVVAVLVIGILYILLRKNLKTTLFEITDQPKQQQREIYIAEGKDQLDNQSQVAKQLLKKIRIKMFVTGISLFGIKDSKELEIFELITYRIADRLNYDVRNDLTRNHITKKTDDELKKYSHAKAEGYYYMIYDRLFNMNSKLPEYNLPSILDKIPINEFDQTFEEIYFAARNIAGGGSVNE